MEFANNAQALQYAQSYLLDLVRGGRIGTNAAVVFDIDDTTIKVDRKHGFQCNLGVQRLYQLAVQNRIAVFFVTARVDVPGVKDWTIKELQKCGLGGNSGVGHDVNLYLRPASDRRATYGVFKYQAREDIVKRHKKRIVLCVGDNIADHLIQPLVLFQGVPSVLAPGRRIAASVAADVRELDPSRAYVFSLPRETLCDLNVKLVEA